MELDFTNPEGGKFTGKLKIKTVEQPQGEKPWGFVTFEDLFIKDGVENPSYRRVAFTKNAKFAPHLKEGDEKEVEISWKPSNKGNGEWWVQLWNAFTPGQGGQRKGGWGGSAPKTPEEIHAQPVATIIAAAMEWENPEPLIDLGLRKYREALSGFTGAHKSAGPQPGQTPQAASEPVRGTPLPAGGNGATKVEGRPMAASDPREVEKAKKVEGLKASVGFTQAQWTMFERKANERGREPGECLVFAWNQGNRTVAEMRAFVEALEKVAA